MRRLLIFLSRKICFSEGLFRLPHSLLYRLDRYFVLFSQYYRKIRSFSCSWRTYKADILRIVLQRSSFPCLLLFQLPFSTLILSPDLIFFRTRRSLVTLPIIFTSDAGFGLSLVLTGVFPKNMHKHAPSGQ